MSLIPEHYLDLLQSTALAYMATIGPKGEPQVSAVWFTWDGTHLLFALNKGRQKSRNLLRDPHVGIASADPANPYRDMWLAQEIPVLLASFVQSEKEMGS